MVDRVTENTFCLKTQDGFHFLNINDFSTSESVRFEGGKILPLHMTDFRTNSFEYVESNIIEVNITKSNINVEEDMDLNCVHFKSVTIPQISSLVFHVIETNYVWSEDISSYLVSLKLQALNFLNPSITIFDRTFESSSLYNTSCNISSSISVGVTNSSTATVLTETKHELEDYQIVELSGIEGMPLHDLVYSVEVLTPYTFILKNISTNDTVDFTRFNHVGQGGTVTTLKALEFEGGVSNSATTTLSMVGPTKSRNIILPDADGTILTTGNLNDISISAGVVTSMNILKSLIVQGNVSIGTNNEDMSVIRSSLHVERSVQLGSSLEDNIKILGNVQTFGNYIKTVHFKANIVTFNTGAIHSFQEDEVLYLSSLNSIKELNHHFCPELEMMVLRTKVMNPLMSVAMQ